MPKSVLYRANSIVYFQGDRAHDIPVLQKGRLELTYEDLQSGAEVSEPVRTGEFFGMKSAFGNYFYDETALAVSDCTVVYFTVEEFESLVAKNPRILMKMLQVFSTQLRRIHNQVQGLLSSDRVTTSQEAGLFAIGEYYSKESQHSMALAAYKCYLKHWPRGIYAPQITLRASEAESALNESIQNKSQNTAKQHSNPYDMNYWEADKHYQLGHYKECMKGMLNIIRSGADKANHADANFKIGYCFYHLKRYQDAVKQLTSSIVKYSDHSNLGEAISFMGCSHEALGNVDKAKGFFQKAAKMLPEDGASYRKIIRKIHEMGDRS